MPELKSKPLIPVDDPMWFYTAGYVDYLVAECIGEFYNKSWLRSIEAQKGKVNSRVKMISIGIDDEINRRYGYPILNGRAFELTDVLVGKYDGDLFPYYNKKEFLDKYGYDKEIPLISILTDTKIFSMRLSVITFDGYSEFDGVSFIAQRDGTSLIIMKNPHSITNYFWKKKMVDHDPDLIMTKEKFTVGLFGPKKASPTYQPNDDDLLAYLNSHFFLRIFTEPHGSVYYYNGLAQSLIKKVQYQGKLHAAIPLNKLNRILHVEKPNDTNAYSLYIGYSASSVLAYSLNGAMLFASDGYLIFQGNEFLDDLIPEMESSTLTTSISLYIFDEYQKTGTESTYFDPNNTVPYPEGTIPYQKNISHPDNIRCYRKNMPDFYQSRDSRYPSLTHRNHQSTINEPHAYWQYNGRVANPGNSIADMGEEVILSYMKAYDRLRPTEAKHRTDKGIFVSEQYRDEVFTSIAGKTSNQWLEYIQYPNTFNLSRWDLSLYAYNIFGRQTKWLGYPLVIDYYEADPSLCATEWVNPYKYIIDYSNDFTNKFLKKESAKLEKAAVAAGLPNWRGNLLWKWNYDFDDYVNSVHYGNLRAYQLSKFAELFRDNRAILHTYLNRVGEKFWKVRSYTIHFDEIKAKRNPVLTTEFIHPNPEDRYHFTKPQYWVESTTTDTFGRFIEVFINGLKVKTNLSCAVNYTNYVFFDADKVPDHAEIVVDISRAADEEFTNKKMGSFILNAINTPIPFPEGFGEVNLSDLVFYNKTSGEILNIGEGGLGLTLTEQKEQFEVENLGGDIENVVLSPGLSDISYLRTNMKDFYKTTDLEKIILSTSRINIQIPIEYGGGLPDIKVDMNTVMVGTTNINGLNIEIGVMTTNHHRVHYQTINPADKAGVFEIPNYMEWGSPITAGDRDRYLTDRIRCYFEGELMNRVLFTVTGPYHPTDSTKTGQYVGGKLKVQWTLPDGLTWPSVTAGELIVEYLPYHCIRDNVLYPKTSHPSGPCGSLRGEFKSPPEIAVFCPGVSIFAGGLRVGSDHIHLLEKGETGLFYFDHVPSGSNLDITDTFNIDDMGILLDPRIDLTNWDPDGLVQVPTMDALTDLPFMMGDLNQYVYQSKQIHKEGSLDVCDLTDITQWGISIDSKHLSHEEKRQIAQVSSGYPERVIPHKDGIYNYRMLVLDGDYSNKMGYSSTDTVGGIDPCYPIHNRISDKDWDGVTALPIYVFTPRFINRTSTKWINFFTTLIIYRKGNPMKIVLPDKFYNCTPNLAKMNLFAISESDEDLYDSHFSVIGDSGSPSQRKCYVSAIPFNDLKANGMTLTDDIVFKYIRAFPKWNEQELTPIVIEIQGLDVHTIH